MKTLVENDWNHATVLNRKRRGRPTGRVAHQRDGGRTAATLFWSPTRANPGHNIRKTAEWLASRILLHQLTGNTQALIYQPGGQPACNKAALYQPVAHPQLRSSSGQRALPTWWILNRANAPGDCSSALPTKRS